MRVECSRPPASCSKRRHVVKPRCPCTCLHAFASNEQTSRLDGTGIEEITAEISHAHYELAANKNCSRGNLLCPYCAQPILASSLIVTADVLLCVCECVHRILGSTSDWTATMRGSSSAPTDSCYEKKRGCHRRSYIMHALG